MTESQTSNGDGPVRGWAGRSEVDDTDRRIIHELLRDGRVSMRALAERVHISRASAYARVERLQESGVITGFTVTVDPERLGLGTAAFVSVSLEQNSWRTAAAALRDLPSVERIALVGAEFDVIASVRARSTHELRDLVLEQIQAVPGVKATRTWLIFEELPGRRDALPL